MKKKGIVSIITPCYNGERLIHRLLDSVLSQNYPSIEMIVVDDGSQDRTRTIIESYEIKFKQKGYHLLYVYQDNAGQAAAINKALPLVNGEYLVWPDADDFYACETAISEMVYAFERLDDSYGVVRCKQRFVDEKTLQTVFEQNYNIRKEHIFEEYFTSKESIAVAGSHMVRMKCFDKVNPSRHIFDKRHAQNFQMFLPLSYTYKIFTLGKKLYSIVVRANSHSRCVESYEKHVDDSEGFQEILDNTFFSIKAMTEEDRQKSLRLSHIYCLTGKLFYALKFGKAKDARSFAKELKKLGVEQTKAGKVRLVLVSYPPLLKLFDKIMEKARPLLGYLFKQG